MRVFKQIISMAMVPIMLFLLMSSMPAFAAESTPNDAIQEKQINSTQTTRTLIANDTFMMSGSHRGATRTYNYNQMEFSLLMLDQNHHFTSNTVLAVRLYDDTSGDVREWQTNAALRETISITYGHRYHFEYIVAYGTTNLEITMVIYGVN